MMQLFIEPTDVWLFRDGRPFNRGSDHRAVSVFPPLPSVIQGVIRSHTIALHGGIAAYLKGELPDVEKVIGKPGNSAPETFRLRGPFIAKMKNGTLQRYYPLPRDVYRVGNEYRYLTPRGLPVSVFTDLDARCQLLWRAAGVEPTEDEDGGAWIDEDGLQGYLAQRSLTADLVVKSRCLFDREARIGIERDDATRSTKKSALYEAEFIRAREHVGLYVEVKGLPDWPASGVISIGGESRFGVYTRSEWPSLPKSKSPRGKFKIVFLTPTCFDGGWQPANGDWSRFFTAPVTCVAAAVGRPLILGGYDFAKREHKPARRYVPAGSVYFFEGVAAPKSDTITDHEAQSGFGQIITGGW